MLRILSFFYSRCFSLSCVSILNIFFPLFEATFQIIFTLKTKVCSVSLFAPIKSINQIGSDFTINSPYRLALTRFVIWQDLLFDKQVISTICSKSEIIKLQQV